MISDGIIGAEEDSNWLLGFLGKDFGSSLEDMAKEIIVYAGNKYKNKDDMTVALIKVKSPNEN